MAISLKGRLGKDPELKTGNNGQKRCTFTFAKPNGARDSDIPPTWINVTCFNGKEDTFAENVAASYKKGDFVEIEGDFTNYDKTFFNEDGEEINVQMLSFNAFDVKTGCRYQTVSIERNERRSNDGGDEDEAPKGKPAARKTSGGTSRAKSSSAGSSDDF